MAFLAFLYGYLGGVVGSLALFILLAGATGRASWEWPLGITHARLTWGAPLVNAAGCVLVAYGLRTRKLWVRHLLPAFNAMWLLVHAWIALMPRSRPLTTREALPWLLVDLALIGLAGWCWTPHAGRLLKRPPSSGWPALRPPAAAP